jgi:outer membrane protein
MDVKRMFTVAVLGLLLSASSALAQTKIGYVDPQRFLSAYKPYQEAQREYTRYEEELNREFSKLQNDFEKMKETYDRQELLFTEKRKQEEQRTLIKKQEDLQRFMKEVTDPERGKLAMKQQELSAPIHAHVNEVVQKVAKDNGYDFVLNTVALVFANEDHDLTDKVLAELQKDEESEGKPTQRPR